MVRYLTRVSDDKVASLISDLSLFINVQTSVIRKGFEELKGRGTLLNPYKVVVLDPVP